LRGAHCHRLQFRQGGAAGGGVLGTMALDQLLEEIGPLQNDAATGRLPGEIAGLPLRKACAGHRSLSSVAAWVAAQAACSSRSRIVAVAAIDAWRSGVETTATGPGAQPMPLPWRRSRLCSRCSNQASRPRCDSVRLGPSWSWGSGYGRAGIWRNAWSPWKSCWPQDRPRRPEGRRRCLLRSVHRHGHGIPKTRRSKTRHDRRRQAA
jgi:hypothetical protein